MAIAEIPQTTVPGTSPVSATTSPVRGGLVLERYFTHEGVHPYDEIDWELRDAVIPGEGGNVFEQRGVEVPKFWSATATNVVASKYFRGKLTAPDREWSVKQMVDRVVDRITRWGIEGGYFANDQAAEIFNHELKYLMVHQHASFNSPVWFNIGVEGVPQQASACQPYRARVSTPFGPMQIGEIVERKMLGLPVYDGNGLTMVIATKDNGAKDVYRIQLANGSFVEATGDHLVSVLTGSHYHRPKWLRVDELSVGMRMRLRTDAVAVLAGQQVQVMEAAEIIVAEAAAVGAGVRIEDGEHRLEASAALRFAPGDVDVSEAALAAWAQGDGFVGQYDGTNSSLTVEFEVANPEERDWVIGHLDAAFPGVHRHESTHPTLPEYRKIRLYGEVLRPFVQKYGLLARRTAIRVPPAIWNARPEVVIAYLRSAFQTDGYVSVRSASTKAEIATISRGWMEDIQLLLLSRGIYSRLFRKREKRIDRLDVWVVSIAIESERRRFADEIGFVGSLKQTKLLAGFGHPGRTCRPERSERIVSIDLRGKETVYDIQTLSGEYLSNNVVVHNCFILSVADDMHSILDWFKNEGIIFKGGSGSGINVSRIRSSREQLSGGGYASGPVSFMRGADSVAGSIKSGGTTRRAAKMVVLDTDHPDVREFIWCKAKEEKKAWALGEMGYDMSLNGEAWQSIQFQNANNSIRATDDFMKKALAGDSYDLTARTDGRPVETVNATALLREISQATWDCGDPGMQFDTTINDWHTNPVSGRINGSNPCFPGDARVHTSVGLLPMADLFERTKSGEDIRVYTHRATAKEPREGVVASQPLAVMRNGISQIVRLSFSDKRELRCTPNHRLWTTNRGWVAAQDLTPADGVLLNDSPTPAEDATWELPVRVAAPAKSFHRGGTVVQRDLPHRWSEGLAEMLGYGTGDGWLTDVQVGWVYGRDDIADGLVDWHEQIVTELVGGVSRQPMENGTVQLRVGSSAVRELFQGLGMTEARSPQKRVPSAVFTAPVAIQSAYLRGLFSADGTVFDSNDEKANRYVGLGSSSELLLKDAQRLLSAFGIRARIYKVRDPQDSSFSYSRNDGVSVEYGSSTLYDLRIVGSDVRSFADRVGFASTWKQDQLRTWLGRSSTYRTKADAQLVSREFDGQAVVYNLTEPLHHSYIVDGFVVANCSEYMSIDDSACNLASLNLMRFLHADGEFDAARFARAVDVIFTAQEILVGFSDYPTPAITSNAKSHRQLGIGYANLGALLMQRGLAYDSNEGRAYAASITALMTGEAYAQSARLAAAVGPYEAYPKNKSAHDRVIEKHRSASYRIIADLVPPTLLSAARQAWDDAAALGKVSGYRNAQASVLAPTGCLVGDSLVSTSRGLVRLETLGDPDGTKWQQLGVDVATDQGPRRATQFYVNGNEQVVSVETSRGYRIQGTPTHRIKVVDPNGSWVWRRFGELKSGDRVPLMLNGLVGEPRQVTLPPLGELCWTADHRTRTPESMTPELAEFVGYFMGDGSLHAKGLRMTVTAGDDDVVARLSELGRALFGLEAHVEPSEGDVDLYFNSVPLAQWWEAAGFAKRRPAPEHRGKGWTPHVPDAVLYSNDRAVYSGFARGLFEADGTSSTGYASFTSTTERFSRDVQTMLLALGFVTSRKVDPPTSNWGGNPRFVLRLLNVSTTDRFALEIGFISKRKIEGLLTGEHRQAARFDHIPVTRDLIDALAPANDSLRKTMLMALNRSGDISRRSATALVERTQSEDLEQLLGFYHDTIDAVDVLEDQPTFDLSVPDNVTYVANGFVSHNTISFMMDCDTTGVEPDIALVKYKRLVGGGMLKLVNGTVPAALRRLGYTETEGTAITAYIEQQGTIEGAPALKDEHLAVFDCAFKPQNGERTISHMGHIKMMGAVQPFISGAISKTVNLPEAATVDDVSEAYIEAWKHGVKAIAIYRDGSKKVQPLSTNAEASNSKKVAAAVETVERIVEVNRPQRRRLPDTRESLTHKFSIEGHEGYITVGKFEDGTPGELFVTMAKEGSTLSGMMDAFATSVSLLFQYGVPLSHLVEKFGYMRFEPSGWTGNPEIGMAKSIVDYVFRWLGHRFLSADEKSYMGLTRTSEIVSDPAVQQQRLEQIVSIVPPAITENFTIASPSPVRGMRLNSTPDAPPCPRCGWLTVRNGTCHKCENCGETTGCS